MQNSTPSQYEKFLPEPTEISKPFWDYCRKHELRMQFCGKCSNWIWYPRASCPECGSREGLEWKKLSGKGEVYSFTIIRQVIDNSPAFQKDIPFTIGLIELEEGPRIYSNLKGDEILIGDEAVVYFDDVTPDFTLPKFQKVK
jgi:uncharacterized OB-fold protein